MTPDLCFGAVAEDYDRVRPQWPTQLADFVLAGLQPAVLVELGAGTGQLTRSLIGRAGRLIALEPDPAMRARLTAAVDGIEAPAGTAERIPLGDASVDAVLVAQALHWFRRPDADREIGRVLRRGGVAGVISSTPDASQPWVAALAETWRRRHPVALRTRRTLSGTWFEPGQRWQLRHPHTLPGIEDLVALARTWSWMRDASSAQLAALDEGIRGLAVQHPELRGEPIRLPMVTTVVRQYRV